ncbi:GTP cyclohydrolase I [Salmonella enterica subsp. enterica serovar Weltevreden]|nr:GTP cyclohydrolase I [Salmonella enterica subsp. enterica serovar Weltevreden]
MTQQIPDGAANLLGTNNVAVSIDAVHYRVKARGIRDATSATTTTSLGDCLSPARIRAEFLVRRLPSSMTRRRRWNVMSRWILYVASLSRYPV